VFPAEPSVRDIENQKQLQNLFASSAANPDPFIGIIVGSYLIFGFCWLVGWLRTAFISRHPPNTHM
jgi:hypothetical protein